MHIVATCPNCGTQLVVQAIICAKCKRTVPDGQFVIAPDASRYAGKPVCVQCLDGSVRVPAHYVPFDEVKGTA